MSSRGYALSLSLSPRCISGRRVLTVLIQRSVMFSVYRSMHLHFFGCSPERGVVNITQQGVLIVDICCGYRAFVLQQRRSNPVLGPRNDKHTLISKPMVRASSLTSSRSSSIEGSLVLLFSKCHKRGPDNVFMMHNKVTIYSNENNGDLLPRLIHTPPGARILCMMRR